MKYHPPTKIRIVNPEYSIGKYLCALLAELGYDIILDENYKFALPFYEFHNIEFESPKVKSLPDFTFVVGEDHITIGDIFLYKTESVVDEDFVRFALYCWGMHRGGRLPFSTAIEVGEDRIRKWKLTNRI